jgi:transposase
MQQRKRYSEEFKRETVGLTRLPGANVSQLARDLGIRANQIHRWRKDLEMSGKKAFPGNGVARDRELLALKLELARVKKERDFLRDADVPPLSVAGRSRVRVYCNRASAIPLA